MASRGSSAARVVVVTAVFSWPEVRCLFAHDCVPPGAPRFNGPQEPVGTDVWLLGIVDLVMLVGFLRSEIRLAGGLGSPAEVSALGTPAGPPG